jgi:glycosyltransferase involved in cell wall biosynthesis
VTTCATIRLVARVAIVNDVAGVAHLEVLALREAGWQVDFHDLPKPGARWPRWLKPLALPLRLLLAMPVIMRLRRGSYEIVHVHFVSQGFVGAASGRPFFLHAHGSDLHLNFTNPFLRAWSRMWMRRARGIFYVTPNLAAYLSDYADKAALVPNPVDTRLFRDITAPETLESVLVFMRLDPIKGVETVFGAIDAIARLVRVTAIDWGRLAAGYRARFATTVQFIEQVPEAGVPALLGRFDAVIGQMRQGVPGLSELQAMAAGRVVLMRLDPGLAGADPPPVVNAASGEELLDGIRALRSDPSVLRRLSSTGRAWVERHHSLSAHAATLIRLYTSLAPEGAQPPAAR